MCPHVRQGWGKWRRLGEVLTEKDASAREGFMGEVEVAELLCGSGSVYLDLTTINHACHIPYSPVSVDLRLISVLQIAGPREKQNFPSGTT